MLAFSIHLLSSHSFFCYLLFSSPSFFRCSGTDNSPQRRAFNNKSALSPCCPLDATRTAAVAPYIGAQTYSSQSLIWS
ncbi:hypothetical protein BDV11DRAFT_188336 [Aspergillus similis]